MVKVLYITDSLRQRFGVTSVIMNYISHFDYTKIKVDLLAFEDSELSVVSQAENLGANVFYMPRLKLTNICEFKDFLEKFFEKYHYDIIHSHFNQIDCFVFPIAKKNGVIKCISHSHNTKLSDNRIKALRNRIMCWNIYKNADICAACSVAAGNSLFGRKFEKSQKRLIIHNAIESDKFAFDENIRKKVRDELGYKDEIVIGNVGSMKLQKNQAFLLKIFAELKKIERRRNYKLLIVGDGELKESLIDYSEQLNIRQDIIFTGSRKDVNELLQAMDIFLLPSLYEGLPVIGIEAQTAGLPCIFSNNITREVAICNVKFIKIDDEKKWVREIEKTKLERNNCAKSIKNANYDIELEAQKLMNKYIHMK